MANHFVADEIFDIQIAEFLGLPPRLESSVGAGTVAVPCAYDN